MNDGKITIEFTKDECMKVQVEEINGMQLTIAIVALMEKLTKETGMPLELVLATVKANIENQD